VDTIGKTVDLIEELRLEPMGQEIDTPDKAHYNLPHAHGHYTISTIVQSFNTHVGRERWVIIKRTPKALNFNYKPDPETWVRIPWIHWPRFAFYYHKLRHEMHRRGFEYQCGIIEPPMEQEEKDRINQRDWEKKEDDDYMTVWH